MRIVGGRWRGRRLAAVGRGDAAARLRPTSDRVREAVFNLLAHGHGDPVPGARVLDAFAGTGALGLEALSRGAAAATFLENGRAGLGLLRENLRLLGAGAPGGEEAVAVVARDARRPGPWAGPPHDLAFLDPPYGRGLGERAMAALAAGGWLAPGALVVWEEGTELPPPDGFSLLDRRRYGETVVTLLQAPGPQ
jgi:16S rRNA (guanine966-N2)-methyltransferase